MGPEPGKSPPLSSVLYPRPLDVLELKPGFRPASSNVDACSRGGGGGGGGQSSLELMWPPEVCGDRSWQGEQTVFQFQNSCILHTHPTYYQIYNTTCTEP